MPSGLATAMICRVIWTSARAGVGSPSKAELASTRQCLRNNPEFHAASNSAAKVDKVDEDYFRNDILPLIDGPGVEFIGKSANVRRQNSWARQPLCCSR